MASLSPLEMECDSEKCRQHQRNNEAQSAATQTLLPNQFATEGKPLMVRRLPVLFIISPSVPANIKKQAFCFCSLHHLPRPIRPSPPAPMNTTSTRTNETPSGTYGVPDPTVAWHEKPQWGDDNNDNNNEDSDNNDGKVRATAAFCTGWYST
jgi:hypothetical protein